ncbi:MAG: hypothetical protein RIM99_15570 [Cyclobacteriaceae bacterium]
MKCVTGKNCFETEDLAIEALIQNHIKFRHREGAGPINVYECRDCRFWHFTSSGKVSYVFNDPEIVARIRREQKMSDWQ